MFHGNSGAGFVEQRGDDEYDECRCEEHEAVSHAMPFSGHRGRMMTGDAETAGSDAP
jgi:hypothetical protein